jgi:hypothetical protein
VKLERLDEYLTTAVAVVIGVLVAYWAGLLLGSGRLGTIFLFLGAFIFSALILSLRSQVWMLVPICWQLLGALPDMPYSPMLRDVVVLATAFAIFVLVAFKVVRQRSQIQTLDLLLGAHLLYLLTVFLRNPVGGLILNSERIGGRPYLNTAIAMVAYWVMARSSLANGRTADWFLFSFIWVRYLHGFMSVLSNFSRSFAEFVFRFYTGIDVGAYLETNTYSASGEDTGRRGYLQQIGDPAVRYSIAKWSPLDLLNPFLGLMRPIWYLRSGILALGFIGVAMGGFRSAILALLALMMINVRLRHGWRGVIRLGLWQAGFLALIIIIHSAGIFRLPLSIQRALTFLPGRWDEVAVLEANTSGRWRYEMWRQMLTTDRYIDNKLLGDGFGFSMRQFTLMQALQRQGEAGQQETFMIVGQVHSGPVSAIRYVGYVGCAFFIMILCYMARHAWTLARRALGTPFETVALFIAVPIIFEPFNYVAIFGSYDFALPETIFAAGLLKMLRNTIDRHEALEVTEEETTEIVAPLRPQRKFARPPARPALARGAGPA